MTPAKRAPGEAVIEIAIESPDWDAPALQALATEAVTATLSRLNLPAGAFEVSILACDDARIAVLNAEFRGKPTATNVLSWPAEERAPETPGTMPDLPDPGDPMEAELGDLALAYETCAREAAEAEKPLEAHLTHLVVHGTLHLLGFDHETDADATLMEGLEVEILATLNMANPYKTPVV
ncbi:MAG: rRNA maturation RNase YbeY [Pseudomonadota bacterium]